VINGRGRQRRPRSRVAISPKRPSRVRGIRIEEPGLDSFGSKQIKHIPGLLFTKDEGDQCKSSQRVQTNDIQSIEFMKRFAKFVLGGWNLSSIVNIQSGFPFTISVFGDTANAGSLLNVNPIRANVVPGVSPEIDDPNQLSRIVSATASFE